MNVISQEQLDEVAVECGRHISVGTEPPTEKRARELWGLMEIIDFQCDKYGDAPAGITIKQAKDYLLAHRDEVLNTEMSPTSFLGVAAGAFSFLYPQAEEA